jgi:predicted hydrolase (HD superfamily)
MINRDEAFIIINKYLRNQDNIKYALAVEAVLKTIARKLERDEELWSLTGLLHNLDYEYTSGNPEDRGNLSAKILDGLLPERGVNALKANNYMHTDYIPTTSLDKALIAADAVTGLIITIAHSMSSKKLSEVDIELLIAKFDDSSFATRYNRNRIRFCNDIGIDLDAFLNLSLLAIKEISDELDL